jgi:hypothetical protein
MTSADERSHLLEASRVAGDHTRQCHRVVSAPRCCDRSSR